jgi:hypothetical protein
MNYADLKKGDCFTMISKRGILLSDPEYRIDHRSGLYYADVEWNDGTTQKNFMICRMDIVWDKNYIKFLRTLSTEQLQHQLAKLDKDMDLSDADWETKLYAIVEAMQKKDGIEP